MLYKILEGENVIIERKLWTQNEQQEINKSVLHTICQIIDLITLS